MEMGRHGTGGGNKLRKASSLLTFRRTVNLGKIRSHRLLQKEEAVGDPASGADTSFSTTSSLVSTSDAGAQ
jgi:hypothetical protein